MQVDLERPTIAGIAHPFRVIGRQEAVRHSADMSEGAQALARLCNARSVAIVGASPDPTKFGYATLHSIMEGGYTGNIYPVNPKAGEILGLKAYPSVAEVPGDIDLLIICIPAAAVPGVLCDAAKKGVRSVLIHSGGYREAGHPELEEELLRIAKEAGMRILGPNLQGIINVPNKLCAIFWPVVKTLGPIGIVSQSGSVTGGLLDWAEEEGMGISAAINLGNQIDLCESDAIDYLAEDQHTKCIAMYLEGPREGRRFLQAVRRAAQRKPVTILKVGRTPGGQAAAASHTGALAGNDEVFSAVCEQFGIVRAQDLNSLWDCAKGLATLRNLKGNRVVVLTTSGGGGGLAVDELEHCGLVVPRLPSEVVDRLRQCDLPAYASLKNPVDVAGVNTGHFERAALILNEFDIADVYLIVFADPVPGGAEAVKRIAASVRAPVAVAYFSGGALERPERAAMHASGIPVFATPERAARGIAAAVWDAAHRPRS